VTAEAISVRVQNSCIAGGAGAARGYRRDDCADTPRRGNAACGGGRRSLRRRSSAARCVVAEGRVKAGRVADSGITPIRRRHGAEPLIVNRCFI
jgi:hypothetical protein